MFSFFKKSNAKMIKLNAGACMAEAAKCVGFNLGNDKNCFKPVLETYCSGLDDSDVIALGDEILAVVAGITLANHTTHLGARGHEAEINNRKWVAFSEILIEKAFILAPRDTVEH